MPLHLLGKKSWNVYNTENIERVRRDEAEAQAKEEDDERRMREADSEHRLKLLRGDETVSSIPQIQLSHTSNRQSSEQDHRRKRRRVGEDDTEREIRLAREEAAASAHLRDGDVHEISAPLVHHRGNINLFPEKHARSRQTNDETEAEKQKKRKELEDQYTMRFSNAAGNKPGSGNPWYTASRATEPTSQDLVATDVWGNQDGGRRKRDQQRLNGADPLAAMKKGVQQLREVDRHREEWKAQRERDLYGVEEMARREGRRRKRSQSRDSLDSFDLDQDYGKEKHGNKHKHSSRPAEQQEGRPDRYRYRHRHRHRH